MGLRAHLRPGGPGLGAGTGLKVPGLSLAVGLLGRHLGSEMAGERAPRASASSAGGVMSAVRCL